MTFDNESNNSNKYLFFAATTIAILSFSGGTVYAWSSPVFVILKSNDTSINPLGRRIDTGELSILASMHDVGGLLGALISFFSADKLGRKKSLLANSIPIMAAFIICAFANKIELFYFGRFLAGLGISSVFTLSPIYLAEIARNGNRGFYGCFIKIFMSFGQVYCMVAGYFFKIQGLSLINLIPLVTFFVVALFLLPESPYYYILKNDRQAAEVALNFLRRNPEGVKKELQSIDKEVKESLIMKRGLTDLFKSRGLLRALFISIGLKFFMAFAGISIVVAYMQTIFQETGNKIPPKIPPIVQTSIQALTSCVSSIFTDRIGRRILLITSQVGCSISLFGLATFFYLKNTDVDSVETLYWLPLTCLVFYTCFLASGLGPLSFSMAGELFPPDCKAAGVSMGLFLSCVFNYVVNATFPVVLESFGFAVAFWVFAAFCALGAGFTYFWVPETKGKSLYDVQAFLNR